jgi:predicted DNA-binding protein YlxM (UPF0122 family)
MAMPRASREGALVMKDVARRALLLDYYSSLLTDKQKDIYEWYYQQDMSLGEISEEARVSRNAVYDLISRTDVKLERYEKALGLIAGDMARERARASLAVEFEAWMSGHGERLSEIAKSEFSVLTRRIKDDEI